MAMIKRKIYLSYPENKIKESVICDMYDQFGVRFNIRSASVTETSGLIAMELEGDEEKVNQAMAFFTKRGVTVEPIELDVLAS